MLAAIGEVAAESAVVEQLMRELFACLVASRYGEVITSGESMSHINQLCMRAAQYNVTLTDEQVEQLGLITKTIDAAYKERNYFVHARWEKVPGKGVHVGIRSARPSGRERGSDMSELWYCTPSDAIEVAETFRAIATAVRAYIEAVFPDWQQPMLLRRATNKRIEELFSGLMHGPRSGAESPV